MGISLHVLIKISAISLPEILNVDLKKHLQSTAPGAFLSMELQLSRNREGLHLNTILLQLPRPIWRAQLAVLVRSLTGLLIFRHARTHLLSAKHLQAADFFFWYRKLSATSGTSATVSTVGISKQLTQSIWVLNYACQRTGLFQDKVCIKYTEFQEKKNFLISNDLNSLTLHLCVHTLPCSKVRAAATRG